MMRILKKYPLVYAVALVALLIRLMAMPHSQVVDSDAVSRVFIGEIWLLSPTLISHGVWGPLHAYFNAFVIWLFDNRIEAPILLHVLFGAACAFPVYFFTSRLFNQKAALVAALLFVLNPVVIRNSLMPMAEIPHAFFIALSMWFLMVAIQKNTDFKWYIFAGLSITFAAGLRYESWVLIALFTLILLLNRKWKGTVGFWVFAMIFPAFWMIGNFLEHGNIFYGSDYATYFNTVVHGVNDNLTDVVILQRLLFFPLSLLHIYPMGLIIPLLLFLGIHLYKKRLTRLQITWLIPLAVMLPIYIFKGYGGTLLLQHRFSITLLLLLVPFTAVLVPQKVSKGMLLLVSLPILLWHIYLTESFQTKSALENMITAPQLSQALEDMRWGTFNQMQAIPRLNDDVADQLLTKTAPFRKKDTPMVLDFFGWDNTYNFAFRSGVRAELIVFLTPDVLHFEKSFKELDRYENYRTNNKSGIMILRKESENFKNVIRSTEADSIYFRNELLPIVKTDSVGSLIIYKFENPF